MKPGNIVRVLSDRHDTVVDRIKGRVGLVFAATAYGEWFVGFRDGDSHRFREADLAPATEADWVRDEIECCRWEISADESAIRTKTTAIERKAARIAELESMLEEAAK